MDTILPAIVRSYVLSRHSVPLKMELLDLSFMKENSFVPYANILLRKFEYISLQRMSLACPGPSQPLIIRLALIQNYSFLRSSTPLLLKRKLESSVSIRFQLVGSTLLAIDTPMLLK